MEKRKGSVNSTTPRKIRAFALKQYWLHRFFRKSGDGRVQPVIPASTLLWSYLIGSILRENTFHAIEALVRSPARRALIVGCEFGDDTLAYFTERLTVSPLRETMARVLRRVKRNKAFDGCRFIGLALDGTGAGRCHAEKCPLCHPVYDAKHEIKSYVHHFSLISVVGVNLSLPFDVEPYDRQDSEYAASQRLIQRAISNLGSRFADYVVVDGAYATAPFLHTVGDLGLSVIARLKGNLPELMASAEKRFKNKPPSTTFINRNDFVEVWDADDFDPWTSLRWKTVRVMKYRQHKSNGTIIEAYWLTDFPQSKVASQSLYRMAKCRWEIENQGFNDGKNRYGMEHITHHHENSLIIQWLLTLLAILIERLYRSRYLKRGCHTAMAPIEFLRLLRLNLTTAVKIINTS